MSITKILADKKTEDEEKLATVAEIVAKARGAYGNLDVVIEAGKVSTPHGNMPFAHLESDSKVSILLNEAMAIKAQAVAYVEAHDGTVLNKKVEELLATNPFFANVVTGTEFDYL
jgi:hypothetical protein|tara:strand:- start:655 stop:999 length:345 start_codon:yes stop_codon:yes gene_type:complete